MKRIVLFSIGCQAKVRAVRGCFLLGGGYVFVEGLYCAFLFGFIEIDYYAVEDAVCIPL